MLNTNIQRRFTMNITNKIYDVISNLVDTMIEKTITPERELQTGNKYYIERFIPNVIDEYYRDPDLGKISALLESITLEDIRFIRVLLNNNDIQGTFKYVTTKFGYEDMSSEFYTIYRRSKTSEVDLLREENRLLKEEVEKLKAELAKYSKNTSTKFTPDNITKDSIMHAKVVINKVQEGYRQEYSNISELLTEEGLDLEPTIKGGFDGLPAVLKKKIKPESKFVYIVLNGYRIDFYFEN